MAYCIGYVATDQEEVRRVTEEVFPQEVALGELLAGAAEPEHVLPLARELIRQGAQAIVARGGNFQNLQAIAADLPLIELNIMAQDVFAVLGKVADQYEEIWLVLSSFAKFDYSACQGLLPDKVHYFHYGPVEDMREFLAELTAPENTLIIGGGYVVGPARARGFDAIQIRSSPVSLRESYAAAQTILRERDKEVAKARQITTILSNIEDGVVVLDEKNRVTLCNRKAEELLGCVFDTLRGNEMTAILPAFVPVWEALQQKKARQQLMRTPTHILSIKAAPITDVSKEVPAGGILLTLQDVTKLQELEKNLRFQLVKKGLTARYHFSDILTQDRAMTGLIQWAMECAAAEDTVLLYGQSGTGKELFAQSIHNASRRSSSPFVAVNCAALSESLLESELFGYIGGAFTGARKEGKAGLFELAHGGTIFLDEINSMSLSTQAKILRVIEEKEVMRLGSDYIIPLDVRVIAAANEDLTHMVRQDKFRRDLFFRLNVLELHIPTLNERPRDIPLLFRSFVAQLRRCTLEEVVLSDSLQEKLLRHNWWGNVRELRNMARRYAILGEDFPMAALEAADTACAGDLLDDSFRVDLKALNRAVEDMVIESLLSRGLTKTQTAQALGISRTALFKKMEGHRRREGEPQPADK